MSPHHLVQLTDDAIDCVPLMAWIADPDVGAHAWFLGVTRRTTGDRVTQLLSYEAHRPMATQELRRLASEAIKRFELTKLVIVHRLGEVPVGEASVALGCSSPHRKQSFAALPWIMDQLKTDVPIWKRETFTDGSTQWMHPNESPSAPSHSSELDSDEPDLRISN
ncbi:Molybdopterin synthase catalytic subunit [Novipirellula galeiformis]|uniref:Molybdopterin synthase catalytic subunit n=1 Tax=Novipirellula galeiformis TaxID=2528004 RepID=A0A5C6CDY6_9BACT|nr:molybdenum cofactor biosynthesis protein MoaE [Novipirellula galeiformis]TWU23103.1 Molybdopterin synthase catalytic subunit [Novipirellula galeiformis]